MAFNLTSAKLLSITSTALLTFSTVSVAAAYADDAPTTAPASADQTSTPTDAQASSSAATQTMPVDVQTSTLPAAQTSSSAATADNTSTTTSKLQGGVQKVELSLEQLRDVGLDLKQILTSCSHLYDEVTIQPVQILTEPEVVGRGIIINIPIGTVPIGPPQPARKDRVDLCMNTIKPIINQLKQNADAFVSGNKQLDLPPDVMTELKPKFKEWVAAVNDINSNATTLEGQTQGPPYNNHAIAICTVAIQKDAKALDETRRAIYKVMRKEGKRIDKSKS